MKPWIEMGELVIKTQEDLEERVKRLEDLSVTQRLETQKIAFRSSFWGSLIATLGAIGTAALGYWLKK